MINTGIQLGTYDEIKQQLLHTGWFLDGPVLHATSSILAGFFTAVASAPLDTIKANLLALACSLRLGLLFAVCVCASSKNRACDPAAVPVRYFKSQSPTCP